MIKIVEKDISFFYKLFDEIINFVTELNVLLPQKSLDDKIYREMILKCNKEKFVWLEKIDKICDKIESKLYPIIEGKN